MIDGGTATARQAGTIHFELDLGAPLTQAPLAFRHADRPWILLADDHQRLVAIDPRPEQDQRIVAEWYLPRPPAAAPLRLGTGSALAAATDGGQILGLDLERSGLVLWTSDAAADLSGPPVHHAGRIYSAHVDGRLRCIDAEDGSLVFEHDLGLRPVGSPVVAEGHVLIATADRVAVGLALE